MSGNVKEAFKDFKEDLPEIDGFEDSSWHNEPCPTMIDEARHLILYVDFADPMQSEYPEERVLGHLKRYSLLRLDDDNQLGQIENPELLHTDDLDEVRVFIAALDASPAMS